MAQVTEWLAGMRTTADRMNGTLGEWTDYAGSWTASTTNPSIGDGLETYRYMQVGKTVYFKIRIVFGSTTDPGEGTYDFGLPVLPKDYGGGRTISDVGSAIIEVTPSGGGSGERRALAAFLFATGLVRVADGGDTTGINSDATGNIDAVYGGGAWSDGDFILIQGIYEVD